MGEVLINLVLNTVLKVTMPRTAKVTVLNSIFMDTLGTVTPLLMFFLIVDSLYGTKGSRKKIVGAIVVLCVFDAILTTIVTMFTDVTFPMGVALTGTTASADTPRNVIRMLGGLLLGMITGPMSSLMGTGCMKVLV